jgi:hypothetical protein
LPDCYQVVSTFKSFNVHSVNVRGVTEPLFINKSGYSEKLINFHRIEKKTWGTEELYPVYLFFIPLVLLVFHVYTEMVTSAMNTANIFHHLKWTGFYIKYCINSVYNSPHKEMIIASFYKESVGVQEIKNIS